MEYERPEITEVSQGLKAQSAKNLQMDRLNAAIHAVIITRIQRGKKLRELIEYKRKGIEKKWEKKQ